MDRAVLKAIGKPRTWKAGGSSDRRPLRLNHLDNHKLATWRIEDGVIGGNDGRRASYIAKPLTSVGEYQSVP
jgi:hypothetical protein